MNFLITSRQLEQEILKIEETSTSRFLAYSLIIKYCREILENYRSKIKSWKFKSISEEVEFFKENKQVPLTQLIFYISLRSIELKTPTSGKYRRKLLQKKIKKINKFFLKNREFLQYVELEHTFMDEFFYTRGFLNKVESYNTPLYWDPEFSTSHDILLARLRAYQKLLPILNRQLMASDIAEQESIQENFQWTGSKVDLIELIYALHFSGSINHGTADIIAIAAVFERIFNIKLDNIYKNFSEIKVRKGRITKFLDRLIWLFGQRLDKEEAL